MTTSPSTVVSAVPAGTPVHVSFGYPGRAQGPPFGGFAGGVLVDWEGVGDADTVGDGMGLAVGLGVGWG